MPAGLHRETGIRRHGHEAVELLAHAHIDGPATDRLNSEPATGRGRRGRFVDHLADQRDPPGAQLMWHGYTQLVAMAFAFQLRDEYG